MITSIIQALFFNKIQPNMCEQEKKRQRIYDLLNADTKSKFFFYLPYTKHFFKASFGKGGVEDWAKIEKNLFNCSRYAN